MLPPLWIFLSFIAFVVIAPVQARPADGGGGVAAPTDHMSASMRAQIEARIDANVRALRAAGKLPAPRRGATVAFAWPVAAVAAVDDHGVHAISNFVDQDPDFPDLLRDYNCGDRTYDTPGGYNHRGVDIFTWPYAWRRMDEDEVEIVAAAPGTIVLKSDGHFDRSCTPGGGDWNAVHVMHDDGSVAWYGHMKNGSPTPKEIGERVVAGEYLGVVGSSGSSTGPHLHLEVYDASGGLIDPYAGTCNALNATSWWADQPPYYDSAINRIETSPVAPSIPACPAAATDTSRRVFALGESLHLVAYYRDQLGDQFSEYALLSPGGGEFSTWAHSSGVDHFEASFWYWVFELNAVPTGDWRWRIEYEGQVYEHEFEVVVVGDSDGDGIADHLDNCMAASNPSQLDSDGDRYGNACDPDLDNNGVVNFNDLSRLRLAFFATPITSNWNPDADLTGDGRVNFADLSAMRALFFSPPGPSAYVP